MPQADTGCIPYVAFTETFAHTVYQGLHQLEAASDSSTVSWSGIYDSSDKSPDWMREWITPQSWDQLQWVYRVTGGDTQVVRGRHGPAIRISVSSAPHGGEHRVDKISAKQCRQRRPAWGLLCWWWWHLPSRTATAVDAETYCNHRSHFERPSCRKMTDSYQFVSLTSCSSALTRRIGCMYRNTQNIGYINICTVSQKKCREMKSGNEIKTW